MTNLWTLTPPSLKMCHWKIFTEPLTLPGQALIRTEADELTYPFHIMIRYEIEKAIFEGTVTVKQLPDLWREKYKEYLGVVPGQ